MSMLAIRLPAEIKSRLEKLAKSTGRSKTFYAKEAILEHLEDLEDYYLAEERLKTSVRKKVIPLEKVLKDYGLDH